MKQRNSDETDITFILLTKIPMNLTLFNFPGIFLEQVQQTSNFGFHLG